MTRETPWVPVDGELSRQVTKMNVRGRQVPIRISPFDIPQAFRFVYEPERSAVRIEFRYPDEEPGKTRLSDDQFTIVVGKFSEKILALEIRVAPGRGRGAFGQVPAVYDGAVSALNQIRGFAPPSAAMNYKAVGAVLLKNRENPALQASG